MATKKKVNKMSWVYKPKKRDWGKSLCVPDETLSIRDMLNRHANGINFDNLKTPFYEEQASLSSVSIHELQKMDVTDKIQYLQKHEQKVSELKSKIQQYISDKKAEAQKNEVKEEKTTVSTET